MESNSPISPGLAGMLRKGTTALPTQMTKEQEKDQ